MKVSEADLNVIRGLVSGFGEARKRVKWRSKRERRKCDFTRVAPQRERERERAVWSEVSVSSASVFLERWDWAALGMLKCN